MRKLSELATRELKWTQPSAFKRHFELLAGDELAATLDFKSAFETLATGEAAAGCWTFKRVGFWQTAVTIRPCGSSADIAVFRNSTWSGGGTLELADGRRILADTSLWQSKYEFKTESDETLLRFKSGGLIHLSATMEVGRGALTMPELPWMTMLGWYLVVMMYMDASAAV